MTSNSKLKYLIKCGRLIDGTGKQPDENINIIVENGYITVVDTGSMVKDCRMHIIDASEYSVLPGLIDGHVHLCSSGSFEPIEQMKLRESAPLTTMKAYKRALSAMRAGFTTLRDAACKDYIAVALRDAIKTGVLQGPDIVATGKGLTTTGGVRDTYLAPDVMIGKDVEVINSQEEAKKAAREQFKNGADMLKLVASWTFSPGMSDLSPQMTVDEMKAAVFEAKRKIEPKKVAAHAVGEIGIINAIEAGVDIIDHGIIFDETIFIHNQMKTKNITLVPTLSLYSGLVNTNCIDETFWEKSQVSFKKAIENGIKIMMGTDSGAPGVLHGANASELSLMVRLGLSEMDALISATRSAAEVLNLTDRGTLEVGKRADIIVVKDNPLLDISILTKPENVVLVMKAGNIMVVKEKIL